MELPLFLSTGRTIRYPRLRQLARPTKSRLLPRRLLWYHEKKDIENLKIIAENSSEQSYFIYAVIMSVVTVRSHRLNVRRTLSRNVLVHPHRVSAGTCPSGGSGHAKKDRTGDATVPRSGQGRMLDASAPVRADFRKYRDLYRFRSRAPADH